MFEGQADVNAVNWYGINVCIVSVTVYFTVGLLPCDVLTSCALYFAKPGRQLFETCFPLPVRTETGWVGAILQVFAYALSRGSFISQFCCVHCAHSLLSFRHGRSNPEEAVAPIPCTARMLQMMLEAGSDPCVSDADGNFPLHWLLGRTSLPLCLGTMNLTLESNFMYGKWNFFACHARVVLTSYSYSLSHTQPTSLCPYLVGLVQTAIFVSLWSYSSALTTQTPVL